MLYLWIFSPYIVVAEYMQIMMIWPEKEPLDFITNAEVLQSTSSKFASFSDSAKKREFDFDLVASTEHEETRSPYKHAPYLLYNNG